MARTEINRKPRTSGTLTSPSLSTTVPGQFSGPLISVNHKFLQCMTDKVTKISFWAHYFCVLQNWARNEEWLDSSFLAPFLLWRKEQACRNEQGTEWAGVAKWAREWARPKMSKGIMSGAKKWAREWESVLGLIVWLKWARESIWASTIKPPSGRFRY